MIPSFTKSNSGVSFSGIITFPDTWLGSSVSNGSNPLVQFQVRVGTWTEPLQRFLPHENPDSCNWVSFTTNNPAFQHYNFGSK